MRALAILLVLLAPPVATFAGTATRFSGGGALVAAGEISADGRYALAADLRRGDDSRRGGRYRLDARLVVNDPLKSAATACTAGPDLFRNGFE